MSHLLPLNILSNLLNFRYYLMPKKDGIRVGDPLDTSKIEESKNFDAKKPALKPSAQQKNKTKFLNKHETHYYNAKDTEDLQKQFCIGVEVPINGVASGQAKLEHGAKDNSKKTYIVGTYEAFETEMEELTVDDLSDEAKEKLYCFGDRYYITTEFIEEYGDGFVSKIITGVYYYVDDRICNQEKKIDAGVGVGVGPAKAETKIGSTSNHSNETFKADCVGFSPTDQTDYSALSEDIRNIAKETEKAYKNNELIHNTVPLKIIKRPWNHITGIEIYRAPDAQIRDELASIKTTLDLLDAGNYDRFKGLVSSDFTKVAAYFLDSKMSEDEKKLLSRLFLSPIIFPLVHEVLRQSTATKAENFIHENTLDINSDNEYKIFYDFLLSLIKSPKHYNIYSKSENEKVRMDKTNAGWVRLPILLENPNQSASWLFKPVENGKYFLISSEKWPSCFLYLENNFFLCRARGWTPNNINAIQQEQDYEQALWIITPKTINGEILYKISPKKWPQMSLYIQKSLINWVDAMVVTNDNIPTNRGLFYLRSISQEQNQPPSPTPGGTLFGFTN